jgi:beta-lactamase regulating signal transducer with metallopeptidase domain
MSSLIRWYPGDWNLDFVLVVAIGVALGSSAAWLISRRLTGNAALRHFVLLSALLCCLAFPVAAWFCHAAGLTLVSVPLIHNEHVASGSEITRIENDPAGMLSRPSPDALPAAPRLPAPRTAVTTDGSARIVEVPVADRLPESGTPPEPNVQQSATPPETVPTFRGIATGALFVWFAGTVLMLARFARNCARVVRLRRSALPAQSERLRVLLQKVMSQVGARQEPLLLGSSRAIAPLAVAFGRPAVILPEFLMGAIGDKELEDILVHEVAHLERGDQRIVLLQGLAAALYWPIASVHFLNRELERAREEVCDNVVLAGRDAVSFGETLLHVAELLVKARQVGASVGITSRRGQLERRIARLIDPQRNKMTKTTRKTACVVTCIFIIWGAVASATRFAAVAVAADGPQADVGVFVATAGTGTGIRAEVQHDAAPLDTDSKRIIALRGKVTGPGDRPVAGARLYLSVDEWTDPVPVGASDADGIYDIVVPEKTLRRTVSPNFVYDGCKAALIAVAQGFGPGWAELPDVKGGRMAEMKPEYTQDLHLVADFPIAGRVVDVTGKPISGASVAVDRIFQLTDPRWRLMHPALKARNPNLMNREQTDTNNWFTPLYPTAWKMIAPAETDAEGRFQLVGAGGDRAIRLQVSGPGMRSACISVLTRDDVAEFTQAIRTRYPRTPRPDGYFYPPRKEAPEGDQGVLLFGPSPTLEVDRARTVSGIVRDAGTGQPIAGHRMGIDAGMGYGAGVTDSHGRYHILRDEDEPSITIYSDHYHTDRYLTVVRRVSNAKGFGEIVANFDIPRGVVISGRVIEAGTDRPIVSAPRQGCHDTVPGPLLAGNVFYFPLSTNTALRGAPTGLYFEGFRMRTNYYRVVPIDGDGRFRIAVPPGPGVLLIQAATGLPMFAETGTWNESEGFQRRFPYVTLATRTKSDGAPEGDLLSFPGFMGPIPISNYHAYRVINPAANAATLDLTISVPRAPTRNLRFVGPDGRPIRGVRVQGLLAPPQTMTIVMDGSEAEVVALAPGERRLVIATSNDAKFTASAVVSTDDPQSRTIWLESRSSVR